MDIRIEVDERDPPTGRVLVADATPRPFSGWLGLLGELSVVLSEPTGKGSGAAPGDLGGQRDP